MLRIRFVVHVLLVFMTSTINGCLGAERQKVIIDGPNGRVECLAPPPELVNRETTAKAEVVVKEIGTLVKASGGMKIDPHRVRQELQPNVANWEVIDFRICHQYAQGILTREDYRAITTDVLPVLKGQPEGVSLQSLVGTWWEYTIGQKGNVEHAKVSLMTVSRREDGSLTLNGRSWDDKGNFLGRYEGKSYELTRDGFKYFWEGDWPKQSGKKLEGTGTIYLRSKDRAEGSYTSRSVEGRAQREEISAEYRRADSMDKEIIDNGDANDRQALVKKRLQQKP